ncbi:hypothetical protein L1049_026308 [Liquidambar formosana]|uniref:Cold regulated protein 27 n=1 Tax=Liquidambar formosana TaxID=63359 RepID=A0AAP0NF93_LIQFO
MEGYRTRDTSESSGLPGDDSSDFVEQKGTSTPDSMVTDPMPTEWTDEKHSLYLKSMEASFVNQLYNSMDLLGLRSQKESSSNPKPSWHMQLTRTSSGQFKVLQGGCWQKINFEKAEPQPSKADGSRALLVNPWIRHFRSASRHQFVGSPTIQENVASTNKEIHLRGKKASSCELAKQFPICHSHLCRQDSIRNNAEVSDQNFVGDDVDGENASSMYSAKRMKTLVADTSSNDQVVPFGKSPVMADVTEKCVSSDIKNL